MIKNVNLYFIKTEGGREKEKIFYLEKELSKYEEL